MCKFCHVSLVLTCLALGFHNPLQAADPKARTELTARIVHVSGIGTVKVAPDVVFVSLTMNAVDDDLLRVRESSDKTARGALDIAKKNGAPADQVEISRLDLSLDFNKHLNRQIYQVRRDATIKLNDLAKLDSLLSDLLHEPNLTVVKISFDTSRQESHQLEALSLAVANAKQQGEFLANLHGFKLGKAADIRIDAESEQPFVTSVVPVVGEDERPTESRFVGRPVQRPGVKAAIPSALQPPIFRLVALDAAERPADGNAKPAGVKPFALGQITVVARVSVDYELIVSK
jgi:hypothetical protein